MEKLSKKTIETLDNLYDYIELLVAYILLFSAAGLVIFSVYEISYEFWHHVDTIKAVITLIHHILLIMIILEILWTIINYMKTQKLSVEAFIVIGIISSIRKMLVLGASSSAKTDISYKFLSSITSEMLFQGIIVLLLVISIFILRKSRVFLKQIDEE